MIFLDMDGVLADFVGGVFKLHGRTFDSTTYPRGNWNVHEAIDVPEPMMWDRINALGAYFWSGLDEFLWTRQLVHTVAAHPFRIATQPTLDRNCIAGKSIWLERMALNSVAIYGRDKHLLARPGRLLIDDSPVNCHLWQAAGGDALLFPQPWNLSDLTVDEVITTTRDWIAAHGSEA